MTVSGGILGDAKAMIWGGILGEVTRQRVPGRKRVLGLVCRQITNRESILSGAHRRLAPMRVVEGVLLSAVEGRALS